MRVKKAAQLLGVTEDDGEQAIRDAYRRLAIKWHPHKCKDVPRDEATRKFREINQAFQALSHWKETGVDGDSENDGPCAGADRNDRFTDLAEMMMFFEFMMGGARGSSPNGSRGTRQQAGFVDVDMMFDFAFGARRGAPAHWGVMDDDDDEDYDDDDYEYEEDDEDEYEDDDEEDEDDMGSAAVGRASISRDVPAHGGLARGPAPMSPSSSSSKTRPVSAATKAYADGQPVFSSRDDARKLTVGELKALLRERNVDYSGCLEKSEMLALLLEWENANVGASAQALSDATSADDGCPSRGGVSEATYNDRPDDDDDAGCYEDDDSSRATGTKIGNDVAKADGGAADCSTSTKARRAARKKAQQKRKKERQKAERSAARSGADDENRQTDDADVADDESSLGKDHRERYKGEQGLGEAALNKKVQHATLHAGGKNGTCVAIRHVDQARNADGSCDDDVVQDESTRRYSQLRDEVLVDVANAVDAGDARGAARALEAAARVGLEPGGQYRALFEHAARLVKAADERRDADAERQKAKEEAAKRKIEDKRARREARRKALADKVEVEERERERREAERREKKAAKKKERNASDADVATVVSIATASTSYVSYKVSESTNRPDSDVLNDHNDRDMNGDDCEGDDRIAVGKVANGRRESDKRFIDGGASESSRPASSGKRGGYKIGAVSAAPAASAGPDAIVQPASSKARRKSKSRDPPSKPNAENKNSLPTDATSKVSSTANSLIGKKCIAATAVGSTGVSAKGEEATEMPPAASLVDPKLNGAVPAPHANTSDDHMDLDQLEAEQLRKVLQMSRDQAAKEEEERKAAARAVERADLASRRERERALQREWNSSQRRAAVQQSKAREADARREAELQRASATAAAVALSGLPGFEDVAGARGGQPSAPVLASFPPALPLQPSRGRTAQPTVARAPVAPQAHAGNAGSKTGGNQRAINRTGPAIPSSTSTTYTQPTVEPYDDEDDGLHLAERSVAGVLDADDDDDLYSSSGGVLLRDHPNRAPAAAVSAKPKLSSIGSGSMPVVKGAPVFGGKAFGGDSLEQSALSRSASAGGRPQQPAQRAYIHDAPRPQRSSSLQAHAPPFTAGCGVQGSGQQQHQQLSGLYGAPAPAGARGPSPPTLPSASRSTSGHAAVPPGQAGAAQNAQQRTGFPNANSAAMQSQLLAIGGAPIYIPQHQSGGKPPSPPPNGISPMLQAGKQPPNSANLAPPPGPPGNVAAASSYARSVSSVQQQPSYGASQQPQQQQQYSSVPRSVTTPYVAAPGTGAQPRWIGGDATTRGPRPQGTPGGPPPPSIYNQRLATAPPFVPAHQRGVQQMQPTPRCPPGVKPVGLAPRGGIASAPNGVVGAGFPSPYAKVSVPLTAPSSGIAASSQQPRAPVAGPPRQAHLSGLPSAPNVGHLARAANLYSASVRGATVVSANAQRTNQQRPLQQQPAPSRLQQSLPGGSMNGTNAFEATRLSLGSAATQRSALPTTGPSRHDSASPITLESHPRWSAPAVDDSLRLAMEMSRQSELADALSTLDDSPTPPTSAHMRKSSDVDARLAAAASTAAEWVPASVREVRAKQKAASAQLTATPSADALDSSTDAVVLRTPITNDHAIAVADDVDAQSLAAATSRKSTAATTPRDVSTDVPGVTASQSVTTSFKPGA